MIKFFIINYKYVENKIFKTLDGNENLTKITENLELINKSLLKQKLNLEGNLEISENSLEEERELSKKLQKDLNDSQEALCEIREIIDKLKKDSLGNYSINREDLRSIEQLLFDTIEEKRRQSYR